MTKSQRYEILSDLYKHKEFLEQLLSDKQLDVKAFTFQWQDEEKRLFTLYNIETENDFLALKRRAIKDLLKFTNKQIKQLEAVK